MTFQEKTLTVCSMTYWWGKSVKLTFCTALLVSLLLLALVGLQMPLAESAEGHDVAVVDVVAWPPLVVPAMTLYANVTVENQGGFNETFSLTVYAETLTMHTVNVTDLAPGESATVTVAWQIAAYPEVLPAVFPPPWPPDEPMRANVTVWAEAAAVAGEVDTADNVYVDGTVTIVWMPPDLDGDGTISLYDIVLLTSGYGSKAGDLGYTPLADFNQDGTINIYDVVISTRIYGATYF
jgi:hypothetical protein